MVAARRAWILLIHVFVCGLIAECRVIFGHVVDREHAARSADTSWALIEARLENPREQDLVVRACCNVDLSLSITRGARLHVCAPVLVLLTLPAELIGPSARVNYAVLKGLRRLVIACSDATARLGDPAADAAECTAAAAAGRAYSQTYGGNGSDVALTRLVLGRSACVDTTRSSQVLMLEMPRHLYSSGIVTVHVAASRLNLGGGAAATEAEKHTLRRTFYLLAPPQPSRWQASLPPLIEAAPPLLLLRELAAAASVAGAASVTDASAPATANVEHSAQVFASAIYGGGTLHSAMQVQELLAAADLQRLAQGNLHRQFDGPPAAAPERAPRTAYVTLLYSDGYAPGVAALAASLAAAISTNDAGADGNADDVNTLLVMVGCKGRRGRGVRLKGPGSSVAGTGSSSSSAGGDSESLDADHDDSQLLRLVTYDAPPPGWQPMVSRAWLDTLLALGDVLAAAGHSDGGVADNCLNGSCSNASDVAHRAAVARQALLARTSRHMRAGVGRPADEGTEAKDSEEATQQPRRRLRIRLAFVPWLDGLSPGVPIIGLDAGVWMKLHAWALAPRGPAAGQQQQRQRQASVSVSLDDRGRTASDSAGPGIGNDESNSYGDGYDCLIFLDGDMLVYQSLEHLFRMPVCDRQPEVTLPSSSSSTSSQSSLSPSSSSLAAAGIAGIAGVSVEMSDLESGSFNVGLLVLRPSLSLWRSMLFDHLAAHSKYQVIETSFLNAFFMRQHAHEHQHEHQHQGADAAAVTSNGSNIIGRKHAAPASRTDTETYAWVLPLNYWCLAEVVARYDDPSLCATFDFSSCGVARWKPWLPGDPPTDEAGLLCRGKPPSPQYKALVAAWRGIYASAADAVAATGHDAAPRLTW